MEITLRRIVRHVRTFSRWFDFAVTVLTCDTDRTHSRAREERERMEMYSIAQFVSSGTAVRRAGTFLTLIHNRQRVIDGICLC